MEFQRRPQLPPSAHDDLVESPEVLVSRFIEKTAFPDLSVVSKRIQAHATEILLNVATEMGLIVRYSGFDRDCSVGRGVALPGSDLDHWLVLFEGKHEAPSPTRFQRWWNPARQYEMLRETEGHEVQREFERKLKGALDPDIIDFRGGGTLGSLRLLAYNSEKYSGSPDEGIPAELDIEDEILFLSKQGIDLVGTSNEILSFLSSRSGRFRSIAEKIGESSPLNLPSKLKHQARARLISEFENLSLEEKAFVIEIFRSPCGVENRPPWLNGKIEPEQEAIVASLTSRGLLYCIDPRSDYFQETVASIHPFIDWISSIYIHSRTSPYVVVPWKMGWADEVVVTEMHAPGSFAQLKNTLVADSINDALLPGHLRAIKILMGDEDRRRNQGAYIAKLIAKHPEKFGIH